MVDTAVTQEPVVEAKVNQGKEEEGDIHEPVVDNVVTQEPIVETKAYQRKNDTQEPMDDIVVTQEPIVEMEADQGEKEIVTRKSIDDVVVTQELTAEMEQFHPREVVTPSIVSACGRTPGPYKGWCSEIMLLLPKLRKWK